MKKALSKPVENCLRCVNNNPQGRNVPSQMIFFSSAAIWLCAVVQLDLSTARTHQKLELITAFALCLQVDYIPYMDELADQIGVKPNFLRLILTDPALASKVSALLVWLTVIVFRKLPCAEKWRVRPYSSNSIANGKWRITASLLDRVMLKWCFTKKDVRT